MVKPLLRGWSHVLAFTAVAVLGIIMASVAGASFSERMWLVVYIAGTLTMFGVSALYHCLRWHDHARSIMRRLDHSAIFLAINVSFSLLSPHHGPEHGHTPDTESVSMGRSSCPEDRRVCLTPPRHSLEFRVGRYRNHHHAQLAQPVEHFHGKEGVSGSNPLLGSWAAPCGRPAAE